MASLTQVRFWSCWEISEINLSPDIWPICKKYFTVTHKYLPVQAIITFLGEQILCWTNSFLREYIITRSLGAPSGPTSSWRPFGPLDFVLRCLRVFRPVRRARLRSGPPLLTILTIFYYFRPFWPSLTIVDHYLPFFTILDNFDYFTTIMTIFDIFVVAYFDHFLQISHFVKLFWAFWPFLTILTIARNIARIAVQCESCPELPKLHW